MKKSFTKKMLAFTMMAALVLPVTAQTPSDAAAKKPKLTEKAETVYTGFCAKATIENVKKSNVKKLTVTSSDETVATAGKKGLTITATAVSSGAATITANLKLKKPVKKKKSYKLSLQVTVNDFSELGAALGSYTINGNDFTAKYVEVIKALNAAEFTNGLGAAIVSAGAPILLLSETLFSDNSTNSAKSFIYNPFSATDPIEYLTECTSNSTAYPLLAADNFILWASHHYASRMTIDSKAQKGYIETMSNLYMDSKELTHTISPLAPTGSTPDAPTEEIIKIDNPDDSGEYDYYSKAISSDTGEAINEDAIVKFVRIGY